MVTSGIALFAVGDVTFEQMLNGATGRPMGPAKTLDGTQTLDTTTELGYISMAPEGIIASKDRPSICPAIVVRGIEYNPDYCKQVQQLTEQLAALRATRSRPQVEELFESLKQGYSALRFELLPAQRIE